MWRHTTPGWLLLVASLLNWGGGSSSCVLKEDPVIRGRYSDCLSINALAGKDAIFDYTLPDVVLPVLSVTVDEKHGEFLGSCFPDNPSESCNRSTTDVVFRRQGDNVVVILPNVTSAHSMDYVIRVTRDDGKTFDPNNLQLTVTLRVYEANHLTVPFTITNVFDGPESFSPLGPPFSSNKTYQLALHHEYSLFINLNTRAPPAKVTVIQNVGGLPKNTTKPRVTAPFVEIILLNLSKAEGEVWKIEISVQFDVQNIGVAQATLLLEEKKTSNPKKTTTIIVVVIVSLIILVLVCLFVLYQMVRRRRRQQRSQFMANPNGIDLVNFHVDTDELNVAEYVYRVPITANIHGSLYQKELAIVLKLSAAMMNTCGGIIECDIDKHQTKLLSHIKKYFSQYLKVNYDKACGHEVTSTRVTMYVRRYHEPVFVTTQLADDSESASTKNSLKYHLEENGSVSVDTCMPDEETNNDENVANANVTAGDSDQLLVENGKVRYINKQLSDVGEEQNSPGEDVAQLNYPQASLADVDVGVDKKRNEWYRQSEMVKTTEDALQSKVLSWTNNSFVWKSPGSGATKQTSFILTSPINFVPSKNSIASFGTANERENIFKRLCEIEVEYNDVKGCVVYMQSSDIGTELMLLVDGCDPEFIVIAPGIAPCELSSTEQKRKIYEKCRIWKYKVSKKLNEGRRRHSGDTHKTQSFIMKTEQESQTNMAFNQYMNYMSVTKNPPFFPLLMSTLYQLMVSRYAAIQYRLGDAKLSQLAWPKVSKILARLASLHYIEGPPGSGKSLIALGLYEKECEKHPGKVLYCCPTETLRAFFHSKGVAEENSKLLKTADHLSELPFALDDFDVIIIDDTQRVEVSDMSLWERLFKNVVEQKKKLYIFVDSKFQDYKKYIKNDSLKSKLEKVCSEADVEPYIETLTEVFRNSKKVFSFVKANLQNMAEEITCNHDEYGDDVLVCHLKNTEEMSGANGLVKLVRGLLGLFDIGMTYEHNVHYRPSEIGIIVGGQNTDFYQKFMTHLFKQCVPEIEVQTAMQHPVSGLVVDTADNFCGLDMPVCIYYPGKGAQNDPLRDNKHYKTYIASRGINLVIFVETVDVMTVELAEKMHMGRLENLVHEKCTDWTMGDIRAILLSVQHSSTDEHVLKGLSSITAKYGDEAVAKSFVKYNGIPIVHRRINKSPNEKIRERALICLTAVALHEKTYTNLMRSDVIQVTCRSLEKEWDPEWWEAAYLLGHLLYRGGDAWRDLVPSRTEVITKLDSILETRDKALWRKDMTSAVAHGDVDYATYKKWLAPENMNTLQYLAMLSLCNLVLSNGKVECYNLHRFIGIKKIGQIVESSHYSERVRQLAADTQRCFYATKIVPGAWQRDY